MTAVEKSSYHFTEIDHVRQRCRSILAMQTVSYEALVKALQGTSPDMVVTALREVDCNDNVRAILDQASLPNSRLHPQGHLLPLPHPSDAEWRFDAQTVRFLLDEAEAVTIAGDRILLFGTPGAVIGALDRRSERAYWVLTPKNVVTKAISVAALDDRRFHFGKAPARSCGAVLMDPPWYLPAYAEMLSDAAKQCRSGAYLYLSVPSEGTRPSAATDVDAIISLAASAGFTFVERRIGALRYINPLFEVSAFAARGIYAPDGWRRSDLIILRLSAENFGTDTNVKCGRSFELTVAGCRLRLSTAANVSAPVNDDLRAVIAGEVFPSVSNRHPNRKQANLWTSTNRAFSLDPTRGVLAMAIVATERGIVLPARLGEQVRRAQLRGAVDKIQPLIQKLDDLVATEIRESQRLTQGVPSWLSTANDARFLND